MKKLVKILSVGVACLLLITSFFFIPKNKLETTSAKDVNLEASQEFNYQAELSDYFGMGDLSINDVKYFSCMYGYFIKFSVTTNSTWNYMFGLATTQTLSSSTSFTTYFDYLILNGVGLNMCIVAPQKHYRMETKSTQTINDITYYKLNCFSDGSTGYPLDIYFSTSTFQVDSNLNVSIIDDNYTYYNYINSDVVSTSQFSSLVDMDSSTSFTFDFYEHSLLLAQGTKNFLYDLLDYFNFGSQGFKQFYTYDFLNPDTSDYSLKIVNGSTTYNMTPGAYIFLKIDILSNYSQNILLYWLGFDVYQPSYRVNNSLLIYNYDYSSGLDSCNEVSYTLRKGQDYYNVTYNGSVPNNKYIQFNCDDINNIIFDEYIVVDFTFDNAFLVPINFRKESGKLLGSVSIGYDFNFSYYVQPLVSNTSSYNYNFKKPSYKDGSIKLSITPPRLIFPVLAWAENILIFFLFYCPVISDLIELINFDKFFAVLLQIFDIYTSSALGDFVLSCFAFILFWNMLALIMPRFVASAKGWDESPLIDTVSAIKRNSIKKKKEKQLNSRLRTSRNNRVSAFKHSKHDKQYMRSSSFTSFKSKNNINRYERAKHRYLRKK